LTTSAGPSVAAVRTIRVLLATTGALIAAYALSDYRLYGEELGFGTLQAFIIAAGTGVALCALLPDRIVGSVLLTVIASLMMLALVEFVGEILLAPRHRPIFQPDERLIFKFIPDRRSVMTHATVNGGGTVPHRINSQGFRGPELRPAGEMARVVVYGDSFIHAFYTAEEETFVARLGSLLAARLDRPVEAVNAGVSSYGPDQIALKLEMELGSLRPDLVVVAVFAGNDYGDLLRNKMFRMGSDGALVQNHWKLDPKIRVWLERSQKDWILKRALRSAIRSRSAPAGEVALVTGTKFLLAEAEREYQSFVVERDDVITNTHVDYYSADVSLTPASASARYRIELMRAVLGRIRDTAARNGIPLAFLFIPHPADVSESNEWGMQDRKQYPDYVGRNQTAPLEEAANSLGVPFLSLYDLFHSRGAERLYLRGGDDHWNAAAQNLAAEAMTEALLRSGLLRASAKTATSSGIADSPPQPPPAR